jgi:hypothetical protein
MLEDTKGYHLNRMLAQLEQCGDLADTDWQEKHPAEIDAAEQRTGRRWTRWHRGWTRPMSR